MRSQICTTMRIAAGPMRACAGGRAAKRCVGERRGHFLELIVEQRVRFVARAQIRADRRDRDGERAMPTQQPDQQLAPDRPHGFRSASGFATIQPTPRTLRIRSAPSFLRSAWMCTSTALLSTASFQP